MIGEGRCAWCKSPSEAQEPQECGVCLRLFTCNVSGGCGPRTGSSPVCSGCAIRLGLLAKRKNGAEK